MSAHNRIEHAVEIGAAAVRGHVAPGEETVFGWLGVASSLFDGELPSWFEEAIDPSAVRLAGPAVADVLSAPAPAEVASAFERHLAASDSGTHEGRRRSGAYYTPPTLVDLVVEQTVGPLAARATSTEELLGIRVFDPAVGCGDFLLAALPLLSARAVELSGGVLSTAEASRLVVERSLYGVDANPLAALVTAGLLRRTAGARQAARPNVQWADTLLVEDPGVHALAGAPPIDIAAWLGAGGRFDAVIGNPPWGPVKPAFRQFLAHAEPSALDRQGADLRDSVRTASPGVAQRWDDHARRARAYAAALRESDAYRHQGPGDADLYRYFVERAHGLVDEEGRLGLLVPGGILRAEGAAPLRRLLLGSGTVEAALEFINTRRLFAIHPMFRFAMLVWQRGARRGLRRVGFGLHDAEGARGVLAAPALSMGAPFLARVGGERLTIPDVRSKAEVALLERLYATHPRLSEHVSGGWNVRFVRELDMTNDSRHFRNAADRFRMEDPVPLYEGRMVHQFDDRAKRYVAGAGRTAVWLSQGLGHRSIEPHFYVERSVAMAVRPGAARPGFCDVTGHANERTMLGALVPADAVAGNKVPTVRFDVEAPALPYLWTGLFNSFMLDWVARRRVATTLNYFQLLQLPFPRLDPASALGATIADGARELCSSVDRWTPEVLSSRARHRACIDAAVASAFGLDLDDLVLLLADFPLLDRHQPEPQGVRSTVTRDLLLATVAASAGAVTVTLADLGLPGDGGPCELHDRVCWAKEQGQLAYIPGEAAKQLWCRKTAGFSLVTGDA